MNAQLLTPSHFYRLHHVSAGGWSEVWNADDNRHIGDVARTEDGKRWIARTETKRCEGFRSRHAACLALVRVATGVYAEAWESFATSKVGESDG